jgi:hypothetical protein
MDGLMINIFVYDRAFLPNNFFIYKLNQQLKRRWYHKPGGNKKRAAVLKWIARYVPLPLVYDSSLVNNKKKMKAAKFYYKKQKLSKLLKWKFEDM